MAKPITYRDLRNTPGQVFERLAAGEYLPVMSEGVAKGLLVPIEDGDVAAAIDAYRRGRALIALSRLQQASRARGTDKLTLADINGEVAATRRQRRRRERAG